MQGRENRLNGLVPPPTAASRSASRSLGPLARLVHVERLALELLAIEPRDRRRGFAAIRHLDESKPANLARELVLDHTHGVDLSKRLEQLLEVLFRDVTRQIAYENVHPTLRVLDRS